MKLADAFRAGAVEEIRRQIDELRQTLTFAKALELPEVRYGDIVIVGREAQLTVFRQAGIPGPDDVLVTVQIARHGMGGVLTLKVEGGLVVSRGAGGRDATEAELQASSGGASPAPGFGTVR